MSKLYYKPDPRSSSQDDDSEPSQDLNRFDRATLFAFPILLACLVVLGLADAWFGRVPRYYIGFYWLTGLIVFGVPFIIGLLSLVIPNKVFGWYKRVNNYFSRFGMTKPIKLTEDAVFIRLIGLLVTIFCGVPVVSLILEMLARSECFFISCSIIP